MWGIFDKLDDGIIVFDNKKVVSYVNAKAQNRFGIKKGDDIRKILKEDDRDIFLKNVMALAEKGQKYSNFIRLFDENRKLVFCWLNVFMWEGSYVFEVFDLSPIDSRAESITDSSYVKFLKYMSAGIAHSIRNPIMSAGGMLARIKSKIKSLNTQEKEKLIKYIEIVEKGLYRIISIIANIEVVGNSLPVKLEKLNVGDVVKRVVERYRSKQIEFQLEIDNSVWIYADKMHVSFVVEEILKNAIDAVEASSNPIIRISVFKSDKFAFVEIEDNGKGMNEEELSLTTIPFYSTKPSNMGIGLSLAKFIVEGYQGDISIDSRKNEGTRVSVSFPMEKRSEIRIERLRVNH